MAVGWVFIQFAFVFWIFQCCAIVLLILTGTWVHDPPSFLLALNPLYKAYGMKTMLVPDFVMASFAKSGLYRTGANLAVWAAIQWIGGAAILDFLRQKSRG